MFRTKLGAIVFVLLTMIGAANLVGSDEQEGALAQAAAELEDQRAQLEQAQAELSQAQSTDAYDDEAIFLSDDELVDDATGIDPTPESDMPESGEPEAVGSIELVD